MQHSGIRAGDIILDVEGEDITSLDAVRKAYERLDQKPKGERKAFLKVLRRGVHRLVLLDYNKRDAEYEEEK